MMYSSIVTHMYSYKPKAFILAYSAAKRAVCHYRQSFGLYMWVTRLPLWRL